MKNLTFSAGRGRARLRLLLLAVSLLSIGTVAFAQNAGVVSGRVSNEATGDYLTGARVSVQGTNISTTSDRGGVFRLTLPPGSHTLEISYTGLDTRTVPITVAAGQTVTQDVALTSQIYALEEFSTTGIREGTALAIQMQRQAPNLKSVAATDTFGNPAANPGELIQRLPGITTDIVGGEVRQIQIRGMDRTFNQVLVDGNRQANAGSASFIREVQIEQMGTQNIETVEVIKAPTPDMDADAIAGYVNLITKRAFDRPPGRRITFNVGSIWKDRESDTSPEKDSPGLDLIGFGYSEVFSVLGGDNNLGVNLTGLYRHGYTLQDEVTHNYRFTGVRTEEDPLLQTLFGTREFVNPDYHYNGGLNVDYKLNDDAYVYLRLTGNERYQYQRFRGTTTSAGTAVGNYVPGWDYEFVRARPVPASTTDTFSGLFTKKTYNYNVNIGGENRVGEAGTLTYDANRSYATTWYPDRNQLRATVMGVGWEIDRRDTDPWFPQFTQYAGPDIFDPDSYELGDLSFIRQKSNQAVSAVRADYRHEFDAEVPVYIKTGLKYTRDERQRDWSGSSFTYVGPDGVPDTADDNDITPFLDRNYNYMQSGGRYGPFPFLQLPDTGLPGDIMPIFDESPELFDQDYYRSIVDDRVRDGQIEEGIRSGYILGNLELGRLRVMAGVRVEETRVKTENFSRVSIPNNTPGPGATDQEEIASAEAEFPNFPEFDTSRGQYRDVFPGIHFTFEPMDGLLFRSSYYSSITRPNPDQLLPGRIIDEEDREITVGNPNLRPFYADNFELTAERYYEPVGVVSVGVFLKELSDYSRVIESVITGGEFAGYTLRERVNVGSARIRGIEAGIDQQFSFLPGFWRGLGAFANFTYLEAEGDFGGLNVQRRLGGQTPRSGNAGLSYVNYGFQGRIMANWRDEHYRSGSGVTSLYREERLLWDLKLQYAFNRNFDLFIDVANAFNSPTRADIREFNRKQFRTDQGTTFTAGLKGRF